ncbi:hypothetical protein [Vibrio sp. AND4]|uniref:hypothetical protein n=1 Tax=Vibrio sp. AND4 TaxID=314289 RepID=UPI00015F3081|nr:hypothetical protein [Vibrio sp. AND4]EDP60798.1 hypothetical protein AND4_07759 [Vibrio sp. AND4]
MERRKQVQWLKIQKAGFLKHFVTHGLPSSVTFVFVNTFIQNDFYLNLSPFISFRLYVFAFVGALLLAGSDWILQSNQYKKHKKTSSAKEYLIDNFSREIRYAWYFNDMFVD